MFHTSGTLVQNLAVREGVEYTPYWISRGIFSEFQQPIIDHWQPYLDGAVSMEKATLDLVRALSFR